MSDNLFNTDFFAPLADRVRPSDFSGYVGHEKLFGEKSALRRMIEKDELVSIILYGPPGSGKTTIANIITAKTKHKYVKFSAIHEGVKDIRLAAEEAKKELELYKRKTILFFDEIHRLNKSQQDALLPAVEKGIFILIGATTENPSFEINPALLSRCKVVKLERLKEEDILEIIKKALDNNSSDFTDLKIDDEAIKLIATSANGDARRALTILESAAKTHNHITKEIITDVLPDNAMFFDKASEEHHNTISAFIKSMRASQPDAAVYYLAKMLEGGENPLFIARRMVIFASEDIGNADPRALQVAISVMQAIDFVGLPEGRINLSQGAIYLACAPKSKASYEAINMAQDEVKRTGNLAIPMHLTNLKTLGSFHEREYQSKNEFFPKEVQNKNYYFPQDSGLEIQIKQSLARKEKK